MFYLKMFYQVIWDLKLRGISFIILSIGLLFVTSQNTEIKKFVEIKVKEQNPYFNALLEKNINANSIARKLKNLPGVIEVKVKSTDYLKKDLESMMKQMDAEIAQSMMKVNFQGIRVELDKKLEKSSQGLVQEYLNRLVGKENITITGVKNPKNNIVTLDEDFRAIFMKWIDIFIIFCLLIVWCFACWSISKEIKNNSYLIEKFQRKKRVAVKTFVFGMTTVLVAVYSIIYIIGGNSLNMLVMFIPLLLVGMTFNTNQVRYFSKK